MTTLWKVGSDLDAAAEAMKSVPTFSFNARPLPKDPCIVRRKLPDRQLQDFWTANDHYCSVCFTVSRDLPLFAADNVEPYEGQDDLYISWKVVLSELIESSVAGCFFCSFMLCRFFNDPGYSYVWTNASPTRSNPVACCAHASRTERQSKEVQEAIETIRKFCDQWQSDEKPFVELIARPVDICADRRTFCKVRFQAYTSNMSTEDLPSVLGFRREIVVEVYATDKSTKSYLSYFPPLLNHGDENAMEQIRIWQFHCYEKHDGCPKASPELLPTRTIEIVNDEEVKIRSDHREDAYVALSYCWGGPQPFATTMATVEGRQSPFSVTHLPAAIQDAIYVTRNLGLKHLWVDSICIIQDSAEDKDKELPMMASYYKNSFITVCAAAAQCTISFLNQKVGCERHPEWNAPQSLLLMNLLGPDNWTGCALFGEETPYAWSGEPIADRAWTYQEQILSPRMVMFGNRLLWQCRTVQDSAGGVEDWHTDIRNDLRRSMSAVLADVREQRHVKGEMATSFKENGQLFNQWYLAVKEYSYRSLSFDQDKFPAISALANEFHELLQDDYIAGLWRGDLLRGLLWSTYPDLNPKQPTTWRAPSWSWASTDSVISFNQLPVEDIEQVAEVVKCTTTPKNPSVPFGEITDAILEIKAPILPGDVQTTMRLLRQDNCIPRQSDTLNYRLNLSDMIRRDIGTDPKAATWEVPANHIMLVLFACRISTVKPQILTKLTEPNSSEVVKEEIKIEDAKEIADLSGLILVPMDSSLTEGSAIAKQNQDQHVYRRVGRFMRLRIQGFENLKSESKMRVVRLV